MDNLWVDTQAGGIEVEEFEISIEEFDNLFRHEANIPSED
jgi:hypothetical protein